MNSSELEQPWPLPEIISTHVGTAKLSSGLNGHADNLNPEERTRVNLGAVQTVRRIFRNRSDSLSDESLGFSFPPSQDPDVYTFRHRGSDYQTEVEGRLRWESGSYLNPEFVLIDATRVEQEETQI